MRMEDVWRVEMRDKDRAIGRKARITLMSTSCNLLTARGLINGPLILLRSSHFLHLIFLQDHKSLMWKGLIMVLNTEITSIYSRNTDRPLH